MATQRLYYDDSYLQTFAGNVESCVRVETVSGAAGGQSAWNVVLDRTAFYPSSGGQPNDLGKLGEAAILDVRDDGGEIAHIVDREVPVGRVDCHIDWSRRFDHMQQHSGQHLLSAMFQERFNLPTVSFHLGEDLCTIDLRGREPSLDILQEAERAANAIIFEDRPIQVLYGTAEQLAQRGVRKEVEREGILRAIEIEGADLQPCGGTHVKSTGQIGLILVRRCTKIRQDWRVEFVCGARAEGVAGGDFQLLRSIGERLSCGPEEALTSIDKILNERDASFKNFRASIQQLAEARAQLLIASTQPRADGVRVIGKLLQEDSAELLVPLASELAKNEKTVALLVHEATGNVVLAQSPASGHDLSGLLKQVLAAEPGKGGGTRDFVRGKLTDPARSAEALAFALRQL
jgi:alanyl-tRNA synthetase